MQVFPDAFPNLFLLRPCTLTFAHNNDQREFHKFPLLLSAEFWASSCPRVPPQSQVHQRSLCGTECARRHTGTRRLAARPLCAAAALLTLMNGECAPPCHAHGCHGHADGEDGEGDGKADGVDGGDNGS